MNFLKHEFIMYPIARYNGRNFKTETEYNSKLKTEITCFLSTRPGERLFNPDYGFSIDDLLFENYSDEDILDRVRNNINNTLIKWFPDITIKDIMVNMEDNYMYIDVKYVYMNGDTELINIKKEM